MDMSVLKTGERTVFSLRSLYRKYGYSQYKMMKFEEYDLYVRNKDFLISDGIITFTDVSGRLMALKPDVTLSIIKNLRPDANTMQKVYYDEFVYRAPKGAGAYKEILQAGLECIGPVDDYALLEVLMLAAESLRLISRDCVLDISHMDIVSSLVGSLKLRSGDEEAVMKCIGEKNLHGLSDILTSAAVPECEAELLRRLVSICGSPSEVLPELEAALSGRFDAELSQLRRIADGLSCAGLGDMINIDFSVISHMNYYNGIVFRGFVRGIPAGILSGGQYNKLMRRMGSNADAVGFAVYLDMLDRLGDSAGEYDVDAVLLYSEGSDPSALASAVKVLTDEGMSVTALRSVPEKLRYAKLFKFTDKGVEEVG